MTTAEIKDALDKAHDAAHAATDAFGHIKQVVAVASTVEDIAVGVKVVIDLYDKVFAKTLTKAEVDHHLAAFHKGLADNDRAALDVLHAKRGK